MAKTTTLDSKRAGASAPAHLQGASKAGPLAALQRAFASRLHAAAAGVVLLAALAGAAAYVWYGQSTPAGPEPNALMDRAFAELDRGEDAAAAELAKRTLAAEHLRDGLGAPPFVMGVAAARTAATFESQARVAEYAIAARYLREAEQYGFPRGRQATGYLLLGQSLYGSGQVAAATRAFERALDAAPQQKTAILGYLADCYRYAAKPQWDLALAAIEACLNQHDLTESERARGLLTKAEIELGKGRPERSAAILASAEASDIRESERALLEGRLALDRATRAEATGGGDSQQAAALYGEALALFQKAETLAPFPDPLAARAMYLAGVCLRRQGDVRDAWKQFERVQGMFPNTFEAFAASVMAADAQAALAQDDEALAALEGLLANLPAANDYANPWLSLDDLEHLVLDIHDRWIAEHQFDNAARLAEHLKPLLSEARGEQLVAQAFASWGRRLLEDARNAAPVEAERLRADARRRLRQAGQAYVRLASLRFASPEYADDLWSAADYLFEAHDFQATVSVLRKYLAAEPLKNRPRALVRLAEALLTEGKTDETLAALNECIQFFSYDPAAFSARLLAAMTYAERGEFAEAEKLLETNLEGDALTPASIEWRDSLFLLGQLLYDQKRYDESVVHLEEAISRYPDARQAAQARYLAAESYAKQAVMFSQQASPIASVRQSVSRSREVERMWRAALVHYESLAGVLNAREQSSALDTLDRSLVRNCDFSRGAVLFELGEYAEAIRAYSLVTSRYQDSPEVLEAFVQIAECYYRLGRTSEARSTIEQAKLVLSRMGRDVAFEETTNYDRPGWLKILDSMAAR